MKDSIQLEFEISRQMQSAAMEDQRLLLALEKGTRACVAAWRAGNRVLPASIGDRAAVVRHLFCPAIEGTTA